ncbi:MAG: hypothetical protein LBK41_02695 [Clostridiales bacterium]|jgi:predicted DNA-binding protein YlxM (UPF0122 family)|nr:hypothetical protein [Clostridiales bacterium]
MDDFARRAALFDLYGELLTEKQRRLVSHRYQSDLSLAEIAELEEITRAAVSESLSAATRSLERFESALGLLRRVARADAALDKARDMSASPIVSSGDWAELTGHISAVIDPAASDGRPSDGV